MRLVDYLLELQLAPDERTARGLILRGDVLIDDRPVTSVAFEITAGASVRIRGDLNNVVSRGYNKLKPALQRCGFDVAGRICLDLGVSTGGFTQALLEEDAARVFAVDVAYGMTAPVIRNDQRVVLLERTNVRHLTAQLIPEPVARVTGDLSFISWAAVVPAILPLLEPAAEALLLIKPQFELAASGLKAALPGGIVLNRSAARSALVNLYNVWVEHGLSPLSIFPAAIKGAKGNREFFIHLRLTAAACSSPDYYALVDTALSEVAQ